MGRHLLYDKEWVRKAAEQMLDFLYTILNLWTFPINPTSISNIAPTLRKFDRLVTSSL
jgi:hypothetical protein